MGRSLSRRSAGRTLVAALISVVLVSGCAAGTTPSSAPSNPVPSTAVPSGEELPVSSNLPESSPGQMPPMRDPVEVTGVVELGVENGCVVLTTDSGVYQLMSSTDPLIVPGARLLVLGWLRPDVMTTCQQGTPLQVLEVHAAS